MLLGHFHLMNCGLLETTYFQFGWDSTDEIDNHPFLPVPTVGFSNSDIPAQNDPTFTKFSLQTSVVFIINTQFVF